LSAVQAAHAEATHAGFLASAVQWALVVHSTQVIVCMSQRGSFASRFEHESSSRHPWQVCIVVSQIGAAAGQSTLALHATQVPPKQTGFVGSVQSVMTVVSVHATQAPPPIGSQCGVAARSAQVASGVHATQVWVLSHAGFDTGQSLSPMHATHMPLSQYGLSLVQALLSLHIGRSPAAST
jgi:hypothetical protein